MIGGEKAPAPPEIRAGRRAEPRALGRDGWHGGRGMFAKNVKNATKIIHFLKTFFIN